MTISTIAHSLALHLDQIQMSNIDYIWLNQGMGKKTIQFQYKKEKFVLQLRTKRQYYEPVGEATNKWKAINCKTLPLTLSGEIENQNKYYVFPFKDWSPAKNYFSSCHESKKCQLGYQIGVNIAKLNSITTCNYGIFKEELTGKFNSWFEFLNIKSEEMLTILNERNIIKSKVSDKIISMIQSLGERINISEPKLIYVDINLNNVLIKPDGSDLVIIDYDYLISGDPLWSYGRIFPVFGNSKLTKSIQRGFIQQFKEADPYLLEVYEILNSLELLITPIINKELLHRRKRLLDALDSYQILK